MLKKSWIAGIMLVMLMLLAGCGENHTVQTCVVAENSYTQKEELEEAAAAEIQTLDAQKKAYTSVHVIESPLGTEYTIKWYLDGKLIDEETKATMNDQEDIVVYELEAEQMEPGILKVEVVYQNNILWKQELKVR